VHGRGVLSEKVDHERLEGVRVVVVTRVGDRLQRAAGIASNNIAVTRPCRKKDGKVNTWSTSGAMEILTPAGRSGAIPRRSAAQRIRCGAQFGERAGSRAKKALTLSRPDATTLGSWVLLLDTTSSGVMRPTMTGPPRLA
jgi:hypothetical protein